MKIRNLYISIIFVALLAVNAAKATTIGIDELGLWAGGTIGLGNNVSIDAAIASGDEIEAGNGANLRSIYAADKIWLGNNAVVNGSVLANSQFGAGNNLKLTGNLTGSSISIGTKANITGDVGARTRNISIGNNAYITGNVLSNDNIWIGSNSTVAGDARAGLGHSLSKGHNVTITGSTAKGTFSFDTFDLPVLEEIEESTIGTQNINGARNSNLTLLPGTYRNWSFDRNTTLNLSAGQYSLGSFWMNRDGIINIDTSGGDVFLDVVGQFSAGEDVIFQKTGTGNLYINVFGHDAWLDENVKISAVLKVYGGNFGADNSVELAGRFYASGNIWLGNDSQLNYIAPMQNIPEPATLAFFAVMGIFLHGRKKA